MLERSDGGLDRRFAGRTICMVAPMPPKVGGVTVQAGLLSRCLEREGATVLSVDTILHALDRRPLLPLRVFLQPWSTAAHLIRAVGRSDVVHVHAASWWGFVPVFVSAPITRWFARKRLVISFHGGAGRVWLRGWGWLALPFLRMADAVAVVSGQLQEAFAERGLETVLLRNLVDLESFPFRARGAPTGRMVWIRKFEDVYDPMTALRVFERIKCDLPDAEITFIGDGSLLSQMTGYISAQGLTGVRLAGRLPNRQVHTEFESADVLINTSKQDGLPTALLEASASGLPIVSTNVGGIPTIIQNGVNGVLVPLGDVDAMAEAVIAILKDPGRAAAIGVAASENARCYGWQACRETLADLYGLAEAGS